MTFPILAIIERQNWGEVKLMIWVYLLDTCTGFLYHAVYCFEGR